MIPASQSEENALYNLIRETGLFDAKAYLLANQDVALQGLDPLLHYINFGQHEPHRRPYPEFDNQQYITDFRLGTVKGNPFFDLARRSAYRHAPSEPLLTPVEIYIYNIIQHFGLFDEKYYLKKNPDIENIHILPFIHYVKYGIYERARNPNKKYNNEAYTRTFGANFAHNEPPFLHYIRHNLDMEFIDKGLLDKFDHNFLLKATRNLSKFPLYSDVDYLSINRDVGESELLPHQHAVLYGIPEGRTLFSNMKIAEVLGKKATSIPTYATSGKVNKKQSVPRSIGVFYHTKGNSFIKEIAENLVEYLTASGMCPLFISTQSQALRQRKYWRGTVSTASFVSCPMR